MGAVSSRARESWRRWRATVWIFMGGGVEKHPGPGPEAHQARPESEGEKAARCASPLAGPGYSSGSDEHAGAQPEMAETPAPEEAARAGGETGLVEIVSLNPGTAETNADVALRWQGAAGVCVQEARLDPQGQVGLRHEARRRNWSVQFGRPLPRQQYVSAGQVSEAVRPGGSSAWGACRPTYARSRSMARL